MAARGWQDGKLQTARCGRLPVRWRRAGGCAEDVAGCSSAGDAVDCTRLRLAWFVSARPRSPCGIGVKRDRRSAYWLWTGVAEAGEARERWRTAKRLELQKRKGGEQEKETSELANSPSSAESESCMRKATCLGSFIS
ncbi:uncharacterized protein M6G45_013510 isoform 1-T1 [Spheniscus humboldti]